MKIKKEYLLLAFVIAGLVSYLVFRQTDRTHYRLPELAEIPDGQISKIQIERAGNTVTLVKEEDKWFIGSENYPADTEALRAMLDLIESLEVTALVSESKNYSRYQLDPGERIAVRAWAGDTLSREFDIGKTAPTYQHTFVRLAGDPNVYHAQSSLRTRFEKPADALRDRRIHSLVPSEIKEAEMARGNEEWVVRRKEQSESREAVGDAKSPPDKGGIKSEWLTAAGDPVNADRVERLLSELSDLECEGFIDHSKKEDLKDPMLSIALKGKKEYILKIYPKSEKEATAFPAVSSESPYVFTLPESRVGSFEKIFDEMLKTGEVK
ncbi:MAG: DUF4340 domain-containing protein [Desulfobacteraceae bacterium]|nr:MAG: DUF4340 domain-containing protein [Desulfobacteraceae bacterium]